MVFLSFCNRDLNRIEIRPKEDFKAYNKSKIIKYGGVITDIKTEPIKFEPFVPEIVLISSEANENKTHIVKIRDTLFRIALQYQTTVTKLKDLNNLDSDKIYVGQKLVIPDNEL